MPRTSEQPTGRRSFVKLIGAVLGTGAIAAIAGTANSAAASTSPAGGADAARPHTGQPDTARPDSDGVGTTACAVWCSPLGGSCQYCGTGKWWFRCTSACGDAFSTCFQRTCAGFCLSQSAC